MDLTRKHSALIVGAPYGGVKEQGPCVIRDDADAMGTIQGNPALEEAYQMGKTV